MSSFGFEVKTPVLGAGARHSIMPDLKHKITVMPGK